MPQQFRKQTLLVAAFLMLSILFLSAKAQDCRLTSIIVGPAGQTSDDNDDRIVDVGAENLSMSEKQPLQNINYP